ncbi:MAG: aminoacyl-tRNA deacylase [Lactobacillaceae bacterium]|jgi:Cys-tRNA(Pro)/Cys-tRNA(Cys) deacylase|nr:aminoacyl-tRNA deacylase [Lactobacillaceae bacterium]
MKKNVKVKRTFAEQAMDKLDIAYTSLFLNILDMGEEEKNDTLFELNIKESDIYKTLALLGDQTGPLIAVIPITMHLSEKKLALASGNKKTEMIPLKDLKKTTGYIHGANNPVGIHQMHPKFPIYFDYHSQDSNFFLVSAGELGRSDKINPNELAIKIGAVFADLAVNKID